MLYNYKSWNNWRYGVGAAILPWSAGFLFDVNGSYKTAVWLASGVVVISTLALTGASFFAKRSDTKNGSN